MPKFNVKVSGTRLTGVYLHSTSRVPFRLVRAMTAEGEDVDRVPGDYTFYCIIQFAEPGTTISCKVEGSAGTNRSCQDVVGENGKIILPCDFRLHSDGRVQ